MKCNAGGLDRNLRIMTGIVMIAAGIYWQTVWGAIGLIPLLTELTGWCPAYLSFRLNTAKSCQCEKSSAEQRD